MLLPMALCSDAVVRKWGADWRSHRRRAGSTGSRKAVSWCGRHARHSRASPKSPFDSAYKLMATFHNMENSQNEPVVRCYVKGAPDVLIARSANNILLSKWKSRNSLDEGAPPARPLSSTSRSGQPGDAGYGCGRARPGTSHFFDSEAELLEEVNNLTLLGMVGIVDPSRS